jgi:excisionase family DNA binding protein
MKATETFCTNQLPIEPLWSVADVARYLGCSERNIYFLIKSGLPCVRVGKLLRFEPEEIRQWLKEGSHAEANHPQTQPAGSPIS